MLDTLSFQSGFHNILIEQGQPFYRVVKIKNNNIYTNLGLYAFKSEIRIKESIDSSLIAAIQCSVNVNQPTDLILSILDTSLIRPNANGKLANNFTSLSNDRLPNLYHWSLRVFYLGSPISRILKGLCAVTPEITSS
jgi:hypothetical protein